MILTESRISFMSRRAALPTLDTMQKQPSLRVKVRFVGHVPTERVARASGVSQLAVDGSELRCVVCGTFQPFLEALHGYEVLRLESNPICSWWEGNP